MQGVTVHAFQDGNRLILSFENISGNIQTAILGMLGGIVPQPIEGMDEPEPQDFSGVYQETANMVEEKLETVPYEPEPVKEACINNQEVEEVREYFASDTSVKKEEKNTDTHTEEKRYPFFDGEYKGLTPEEALEQNRLYAIKTFYDKRNVRPYNSPFMKKKIKEASKKYVEKLTRHMSKMQIAFDWLFDNYPEGTSKLLQSRNYEVSKSGIENFCNHEPADECKKTIIALFENMINDM